MKKHKLIDLSFLGTPEQIKEQHRKNALTLSEMFQKAKKTGKRVNGYFADQLLKMYQRVFDLIGEWLITELFYNSGK